MFVGGSAVVLDQVARNDDEISAPVLLAIVIEDRAQRRIGDGAAQISAGVREQMRISKVQYPQ